MFRLFAALIFAGAFLISAFHRRKAARHGDTIRRRRESKSMIAGRLLVAVPLFGGVVTYLINPGWMRWAALEMPAGARWSGVVMGAAAIPLVHWVLTSLGKNVSPTVLTKDDQALVEFGPYRWIRHPLYTTGVLLLSSIGLMAANWFLLLFAGIAAVAVRAFIVPREEDELVARFGRDYEAYRQRTGAMLPKLGGGG